MEKRNMDSHLTRDEKEVFYTVYEKLSSARSQIAIDKFVGKTVLRLLGAAVNQAKLEMPEDIEKYTEKLCNIAAKAYSANLVLDKDSKYSFTMAASPKRKEKIKEEHQKLIRQIEKLEDPLKLFSKYLKIKIN